MKNNYLTRLLQIRLLVGRLGERAQFNWWPTAFYESSSRSFLEPVFTKTLKLAQYHGVLEAARRLHDDHLSVGSYHLFRLPEEVEQDLHALVPNAVEGDFSGKPADVAAWALSELSKGASVDTVVGVGPLAVGSIQMLEATDTASSIAGAYFSAFPRTVKIFPYLKG
jgi:hypothetical protein